MTLTVKLDEQDKAHLEALIIALNIADQSKLVRKLIKDRFTQLQTEKTLVERRGGHPKNLLQGQSTLSNRDTRKAIVAEKIKAKTARRKAN